MKDNTEKTVEEFEREAKERIAARKGKGPKLAQTYDELILASIAVKRKVHESLPFYAHGKQVDPRCFASRAVESKILQHWKKLDHASKKELNAHPPTAKQLQAILCLSQDIEGILYTICKYKGPSYLEKLLDNHWSSDVGNYALHQQYWLFMNLTLLAQSCEIDNILDHYKLWKPCNFDILTMANLPIVFLEKTTDKQRRRVWARTAEKIKNQDIIVDLEACSTLSRVDIRDFPYAFGCSSINFETFNAAVKRALLYPQDLFVHHDEVAWTWNPGHEFIVAVFDAYTDILQYFRRARAKCSDHPHARHKWLEAEAELVKHWDADNNPITPEVADHIIALADDAAREQWAESRMGKDTKALDEATDRKPLRPPTTVRLADDQMAQITKGQSTIKKKLNSVDLKVSVEHMKKNERSTENKQCVDFTVRRYYELINKGTPRHNALSIACKDTVEKKSLGDYKSVQSLRAAVNREIKAREAYYGAKAADLNLPNPK